MARYKFYIVLYLYCQVRSSVYALDASVSLVLWLCWIFFGTAIEWSFVKMVFRFSGELLLTFF